MFQQQQSSELEKMCGGLTLTRTQRFYAFGTCFGIGFVLSFISTIVLWTGNLTAFAVLYSVGNVISLFSTGFLIGFVQQIKKMFDPSRLVAAIVFLLSLVATLISAFAIASGPLTMVCCVVQYFALIWYSISYIPFARDFVKNIIGGCFGGR